MGPNSLVVVYVDPLGLTNPKPKTLNPNANPRCNFVCDEVEAGG